MSKQIVTISVLALSAFGGCDRPTSSTTNAQSMSGSPAAEPGGYGGGPMTGGPMTETPMSSGADESIGGGPKAEMVSIASATDKIGQTRCRVEMSCKKTNDIKAKSIEACVHDNVKAAGKNVNGQSCTHGVDQVKLDACLDALKKTSCDAIKGAGDVDACKASALCP